MIEDEMVGWHHQLDGLEFEQVPGVGDAIQPSHPLSDLSLMDNIYLDMLFGSEFYS